MQCLPSPRPRLALALPTVLLLLSVVAPGCSSPSSSGSDSATRDGADDGSSRDLKGGEAWPWDGPKPEASPKPDGAGDGQLLDGRQPTEASTSCAHPKVAASCAKGFCTIPAGCFWMGSPASEPCREPWAAKETRHAVTLTRSFIISALEVTQAELAAVLKLSPSAFPGCGGNCPVDQVTWHQAAAYCNALSKQQSLAQCYSCTLARASDPSSLSCVEASGYGTSKIYSCPGYRLPTEAEWEYAYRAGTSTALYNGPITVCGAKDNNADAIGWYFGGSSINSPRPGGQKTANAWGLHDMAGNVWEWCHDVYRQDLGGNPAADPWGVAPTTGMARVLRGGAWDTTPASLRGAARYFNAPAYKYPSIGFRCVRTKP